MFKHTTQISKKVYSVVTVKPSKRKLCITRRLWELKDSNMEALCCPKYHGIRNWEKKKPWKLVIFV